jgi:23S rRNA (adenine2030-N6)-methyltransferase
LFSYRHAFHAANHADVLKHAILIHILDYLGQKGTPYWVIDTHAGAGMYRLDSDWAGKNAEFAGGIGRLWERTDAPPLVARYLERIKDYNSDGRLRQYPGSPWLALDAMREHDRLRLFEQHPAEAEVLVGNLERRGTNLRQVTVFDSDGFEGMKALLPPPPRRGLVLIDPSYEDKQDYRRTAQAVKEGLKRFATGTYAVWYPQVQRRESLDLPRQLEKLGARRWVHAALTVKKPADDGFGLHGSGMFLVNPPWTLAAQLKEALPWLKSVLGQDARARFTLDARED